MKQQKTINHGGARHGAGRKPKRPTRTLAYRVPLDKAEVIDQKIRAVIKKATQE